MKVVLTPFLLLPEHKEQWLKGLIAHAELSLKEEPGCLRFDIIQDADEPNKIWLYEVFTGEKAYAEHNETYHYKDFAEMSKGWTGPKPLGAGRGAYTIWPPDDEWK